MRTFDRCVARFAEACSIEDLRDAMQEALRKLDIDAFIYVRFETMRRQPRDGLIIAPCTAGPAEPHPTVERRRLDAVVERAMREHLPFFGEGLCLDAGRTEWIIPIHDVPGRLAVVAFGTSGSEDLAEATLARRQVVLHAISMYLHAHTCRIADSNGPPQSDVLTSRELQCLQWAARGKSHTDTGQILGLSPRTIKFHLENARRKLGAAHTGQAVLRAAMLGLVTADQGRAQYRTPDPGWHLPWQRYRSPPIPTIPWPAPRGRTGRGPRI